MGSPSASTIPLAASPAPTADIDVTQTTTAVTPSPSPGPSSSASILPTAYDAKKQDAGLAVDLGGCQKVYVFLLAGTLILACLTALIGYSIGKKRTLKLMADSSNTSSLLRDAVNNTPLESPKAIKEGLS